MSRVDSLKQIEKMMDGPKARYQRTNPLVYIFLTLGGIAMIFPFLWMIATSLKHPADIYSLSILPPKVTFSAYTRLFAGNYPFPRWFVNTFFIAFTTTASTVFFDSLVGYALCKFRFRGQNVILVLILSTMMIPQEMLIIPWYVTARNFGWNNSYWGIMFPGIMSALGVFLMKQFFESVPDELLDSGRIDGLNELQIWARIAMPLVKPAISALAIFSFLSNWNAFLWPLIVTTNRLLYTLQVGLALYSGEFAQQWEMIMAGASIATIPVLIVFLIFQRQIIQGIALTGIKG